MRLNVKKMKMMIAESFGVVIASDYSCACVSCVKECIVIRDDWKMIGSLNVKYVRIRK